MTFDLGFLSSVLGGWAGVVGLVLTFVLLLAYLGAPLWIWSALVLGGLFLGHATPPIWGIVGGLLLVLNVPVLRQILLSSPVMKLMKNLGLIPKISETELQALKAGNVWIEREFFSGKPNFKRILKESYPDLTQEEKAFLGHQVEELCALVDDWEVWKNRDLSPEAWDYLKREKFLGMIIPKEYGGLGFSALAHSAVIGKLASRSVPLCITAMVPNSLGPAELLNHYGTEEQKKHYLPRLAVGEEIPCFALTEPHAGSDAGSIRATGTLFKDGKDGKLYIRLNWNKRWITLAAISTVLGLAFRLKDPDGLLGQDEDVGITCALIPSSAQGVELGKRHDPLGVPFYNCPTRGHDVVVPADAIIGGIENAGKGWNMLMESLAAGRGISLPAQSTFGTKFITRALSAHTQVRKQFGVSVGNFHGVAEPLSRIAGFNYLLEAARTFTAGAIDSGSKPPVITAIAKYNFTELARQVVNDALDVQGGAGISRGPKNFLAHSYYSTPISITVEGANILTRTLIVFGQGALRGHPYAFREVDAMMSGNLKEFDRAFWAHIGLVIRNKTRAFVLSLTRGFLVLPPVGGPTKRYYQKLAWASATFAFLSDLSMALLGGRLKMMGKLTGRFADVLSWMYLATSVLRRFEADGRNSKDLPFVKWSLDYSFHRIQEAFDGIYANFDLPLVGWAFKMIIRPLARFNSLGAPPTDRLELEVAQKIQEPGPDSARIRLTEGAYFPTSKDEPFAQLENAFVLTWEADQVDRKIRKAVRKKAMKKQKGTPLHDQALSQGVITQAEYETIAKAAEARNEVIQVDEFTLKEYAGMPTPR